MSSSIGPTPSGGESRTIAGPELSPALRAELLALARASLEALVGGRPLPDVAAGVVTGRGAFVTLAADGALRGCVGRVTTDRPLAEVVRDMTVAAARDDPRFAPVEPDELAGIRIEIAVLHPPRQLAPPEPERIVVGRDGLVVRRGRASGVLLPKVAIEQGMGAAAFLAATCRKAGLPPEAWREPETVVLTFQAEVFGE